jgi:tripartite-type tricarboxylate transporter receptor subunit TctC
MRKLVIVFIAAVVAAFNAGPSRADDKYPTKPIQLIVPYGVGGLTDFMARLVADKLAKNLGTSIVVLNKPGAGTAIGAGFVAASEPDGHTLLINMTGGAVVTPMINPNIQYKMSDLKPIGKLSTTDYLVLALPGLAVNTLPELVAYAKKNPGKLSYATPGSGSLNHLAAELLNLQNQMGMQHVPFTNELQIVNAMMGNHVQVAVVSVPSSLELLQANRLKALAILAEHRDPLLPNVGTSAEQGFPDLLVNLYNVLFAPVQTPAPVFKRLEDALGSVFQDEELIDNLKKMRITPDYLNSTDTQAFLDGEVRKWAVIVKKANITMK